MRHDYVAPALSQYQLGDRARPSKDCLMLDMAKHRLYALPITTAMALARQAGGEAMRRFADLQQPAYLRAAASILGQQVNSVRMQQRRKKQLAELKYWLDQNAIPF